LVTELLHLMASADCIEAQNGTEIMKSEIGSFVSAKDAIARHCSKCMTCRLYIRNHVVLVGDGRHNSAAARLATHGHVGGGGDGGGSCTAGLAMSSVMVAHSGSESVLGSLSPTNNNNNSSSFHVNNNNPSPGDLALLAKLEEANR
jgi:hypothetical protein